MTCQGCTCQATVGLSRLLRVRGVLLLRVLGHFLAANIDVGVALRALLHRSPLRRREESTAATFLADGFDRRPSRVGGARCSQFRRASLELIEYRLRSLDIRPLHPDLGLVEFRDQAAHPRSDLGYVLGNKCFQASVEEGISHEDSLQVILRVVDSNWFA
jgi:hypothetical protein